MRENDQWWTKKKLIVDSLSRLDHHMQSLGNMYRSNTIVLRLFVFIRYQHNTRRHHKHRRDGHAQ